MARPPERRRPREAGDNPLAALDGFAAGPVVRQDRDQNRNALQDNSMGAHMAAILDSDLTDNIDDVEAEQRAEAHRITDNFGPAFAAYRRQIDGPAPAHEMDARERLEGPRGQARPQGGNLPAVVGGNRNALAHADAFEGRDGPMTDFIQLRRMPAYMMTQIRRLGRDIFAQYAPGIELEDINMMGNMPGFHSPQLVRDHIRWIANNGHEVTSDDLDFGQNVPGYKAKTSLWEVDHFNFLIVKDNHGEYVYGWPRAPRPAIAAAPNYPRLR